MAKRRWIEVIYFLMLGLSALGVGRIFAFRFLGIPPLTSFIQITEENYQLLQYDVINFWINFWFYNWCVVWLLTAGFITCFRKQLSDESSIRSTSFFIFVVGLCVGLYLNFSAPTVVERSIYVPLALLWAYQISYMGKGHRLGFHWDNYIFNWLLVTGGLIIGQGMKNDLYLVAAFLISSLYTLVLFIIRGSYLVIVKIRSKSKA